VIYDEYPDQFSLYKMSKDILAAIRSKVWDGESKDEQEAKQLQSLIGKEGVEDYVLLVLLQEILKRRYKAK
jgi:cell division protein FtsI/penicillin-binding protein 2